MSETLVHRVVVNNKLISLIRCSKPDDFNERTIFSYMVTVGDDPLAPDWTAVTLFYPNMTEEAAMVLLMDLAAQSSVTK